MLFYDNGDLQPFAAPAHKNHRFHALVLKNPSYTYDEEKIFAIAAIAGLSGVMKTPGGLKIVEVACDAYRLKYPFDVTYKYVI